MVAFDESAPSITMPSPVAVVVAALVEEGDLID